MTRSHSSAKGREQWACDYLGREVARAVGHIAKKSLIYFKTDQRSARLEFGGAWHHFKVERMAETGLCWSL